MTMDAASLKRNFDMYDKDRSGSITIQEMGMVLGQANPNLSQSTLQYLISKYDHSKDGTISYQEFIGFINGNPSLGLGGAQPPQGGQGGYGQQQGGYGQQQGGYGQPQGGYGQQPQQSSIPLMGGFDNGLPYQYNQQPR